MKRIQIFMDEGVLEKIDDRVGRGSRSEFIRDAVDKELGCSVTTGRAGRVGVDRPAMIADGPKGAQGRREVSNPPPPTKHPRQRLVRAALKKRGRMTSSGLERVTGLSRGDVMGALMELGAEQEGDLWGL